MILVTIPDIGLALIANASSLVPCYLKGQPNNDEYAAHDAEPDCRVSELHRDWKNNREHGDPHEPSHPFWIVGA